MQIADWLPYPSPFYINIGFRLAWNRGSAKGHVAYVILLGLLIEYLGPSMTAPPSHVI